MGHARKRMYNELPEPPARRTRQNGDRPTSQLEASQYQRNEARGRLGKLFIHRSAQA